MLRRYRFNVLAKLPIYALLATTALLSKAADGKGEKEKRQKSRLTYNNRFQLSRRERGTKEGERSHPCYAIPASIYRYSAKRGGEGVRPPCGLCFFLCVGLPGVPLHLLSEGLRKIYGGGGGEARCGHSDANS